MLSVLAKIESVTMPEAFLISLVGFSIVFAVLVVLMAMILLLRYVVEKFEAPKHVIATATDVVAPIAATPAKVTSDSNMVPAKGSLGEIKLFDVDDKTAALVMAIVADEMKAPLNELRFHSIREKK